MTDHIKAIKDSLEAGVTGYANGDDWMAIGGNTVMLNSGRPVWARIATCEHAPNAAYIAACNPTAICSLLSRLEEAERAAERAKRCALKYLDYLGIKNRDEGLARDMLDPEMVGAELAAMKEQSHD